MRIFDRTFFAGLFIAASFFTLGAFGAYQYRENLALASRVVALESQTAALARALQASNAINEENKEEILELANRQQVVARSQEDLLTDAVAAASPAVVSVVISRDVPLLEVQYINPFGDDPTFRDFNFRVPTYRQVGTEKQQIGAGTGFIVRRNGYIVTNRHVVEDPSAEYVVLLSSGEQKVAEVFYRDPANDLAILKIEGNNYPVITLGESSDLRLGQTVAAIGNALGEYSNTVSVGIISGLDRTIEAVDSSGRVETLSGVIQTDAAINRGNSGGPLLDLSGSAIGVNVALQSGAQNIAFAIPVSDINVIVERELP